MVDQNVGGLDRVFRVGLGTVLAVVGFSLLLVETLHLAVGAAVLVVALVLLSTAATQRCYVNAALGRNTCRTPEPAE